MRLISTFLIVLLVAVVAVSCGKDKKGSEVDQHLEAARQHILDRDRQIKELSEAIELDEQCVEAYELRAEVYGGRYRKTGRSEDAAGAITDYDKLMKLEPKNPKAAEWLRKRAWLKGELTEYDEAIADLKASLKRQKRNWRTYEQLAKAYISKEELTDAIKAYSLAIKYDRNNASLYKDRARVYFKLDQKEKAIPDLEKVTELQPDLEAYAALAQIYRDLGDPHKALDYYNKAKSLDPDFDSKVTPW